MKQGPWIHYSCPRCGADSVASRDSGAESPIRCGGCGFDFPRSTTRWDPSRPLERCALCGGEEFYSQRDFNRKLGLGIVAGTAVLGFVMMLLFDLWGLLILGVVTAADALIYRFLPEVSVCYLCQTVYHGFPRNPGHGGFYLGSEERFKAMRQAWLEGLSR